MNKCYYRIEWKNYPSDETPLNEQNLNKIDVAVDEIDNRIISLDSTKFDKSEAQLLVKYIEYDENNGIFKITHYNGASYTIDTLLEKLAVNFDYDYQTQQLIIELSDGEIKYVDLSALITQYEFLDSETVAFSVDNGGKVTAIVKEGSIEGKHLSPDYLADIKVESAKAEASATKAGEKANNSAQGALLSKSYSDGDSGIRDGEATDNARYYSEQAKKYFENLEQTGTVTGIKGNSESSYRTGNVNLTAQNVGALPTTGGTMTGAIYSNSHIYNSDGTFDIDLGGNIFDIGIRDSQNSWIRRLVFSKSNDIRMECGEKLDLVGEDGGKQWNAAIGENFKWKGTGASALEIKGDGGASIYFADSSDIRSGAELRFHSYHSMLHLSEQRYDVSARGEADLRSGGKFSIRSAGDIQLISGTNETNAAVGATNYVRTGHIKGIKDVNGNKPSITNFGNINSETYNGKKVITSAGGVIDEEDGLKDGRSIEFNHHQIKFTLLGNTYGGTIFKDTNGISRGGFGFYENSNIRYHYIGSDVSGSGELRLRSVRAKNAYDDYSEYNFNGIKTNQSFEIFSSDGNYGIVLDTDYGSLRPNIDRDMTLGGVGYRWDGIYSSSGTIQTSDRTQKNNIAPLTYEMVNAFIMGLRPSAYGMVNGRSGRTHWGLIAQDIEELMYNLGMDSKDFAGFIKSPKIIMHTTDEDGNFLESPVKEIIEGEYEYSLRYDEFIAPIIKVIQMQQAEIESLKAYKAQLEARLAKIEERLGI